MFEPILSVQQLNWFIIWPPWLLRWMQLIGCSVAPTHLPTLSPGDPVCLGSTEICAILWFGALYAVSAAIWMGPLIHCSSHSHWLNLMVWADNPSVAQGWRVIWVLQFLLCLVYSTWGVLALYNALAFHNSVFLLIDLIPFGYWLSAHHLCRSHTFPEGLDV